MKTLNQVEDEVAELDGVDRDPLLSLVTGRETTNSEAPNLRASVVVGELIAMTENGDLPLVIYPGQPTSAAIVAHSVVDLHGAELGKKVVLAFDGGNPEKPIVLGVIRSMEEWPLGNQPAQVEVDADGKRVSVVAKDELVLRCGKASITLTKAGKVLIQGSYVSSRSSGVNRIKGGSVHIN